MVRVIRNKSLFKRLTGNVGNFKLFGFLGVMTLIAGLTLYLTTQQQDLRQQASGIENIEYGFNTHINTTEGTGYWENLTLDVFKRTVDDLVANNQKWIRFNLTPWETATAGTSTSITWNESAMIKYDEAVNYANNKGLKIYLVTSTPDFANSLSASEYQATTVLYHKELAARYKDKIDVWQIFNEADAHNFKGYALFNDGEMTSAYLDELKTILDSVKKAINVIDPNVKIASNVSGYPLETKIFDRWNTYFDKISPVVDILGLDVYARSVADTQIIKSATIGVASKYGKPIIIAETGFPSGTADSSEELQAQVIQATVSELRHVMPIAIILYQYSDTLPNADKTESSFGVVRVDGTRKSSYTAIMDSLAFPKGLLRIETNPAVGVTMTVTSLTTNQVVLTKTWGVDWEKLPVGNYRVTFTNPDNLMIYDKKVILPTEDTNIIISANQTTTIVADLTTGKFTIEPFQNQITPTSSPPTPTSIPSPTPIPNTPTPTPQTTGLLRVETSPATAATIKILQTNGKVVMSSTWSIDWKPLAQGTYFIQFSHPRTVGLITPRTTLFKHYSNKVTEIIGNFTTGKTTIKYH